MKNDTKMLLEQYCTFAEGTSLHLTPKVANRNGDKLHSTFKILSLTEEGRNGICELMNQESPYVRLWAASHSLLWFPDNAKKVLQKMVDDDGPSGFLAEMTLEEYAKGTLSFEH